MICFLLLLLGIFPSGGFFLQNGLHGLRTRTRQESARAPSRICVFPRKLFASQKTPNRLAHLMKKDDLLIGNKNDNNDLLSNYEPFSLFQKAALTAQLALAVWLLLLLPTQIFGSSTSEIGIIPYQYFLFFGLGSLPQKWRFGRRKQPDRMSGTVRLVTSTSKRGTTRSDLVLFLTCLVACHWAAIRHYLQSGHHMESALYLWRLRLGNMVQWLAVIGNASAAWTLGRSFDLVRAPDKLVMTGPYAIVRHPIYTTYLVLFGSTLWLLGSHFALAVFLVSFILFYSARVHAEEEILAQRFPNQWVNYTLRVPWRLVPGVW